ncbi:MAG: oxidoreductase [Planctomycetota bacterium]|nr:MAG: oxidoreductase [Planctomycetota bacterium]
MTDSNKNSKPLSAEELLQCLDVLRQLDGDSDSLSLLTDEQRIQLLTSAGRLARPDKGEIKKRSKARKKLAREKIANKEKEMRSNTGIRKARQPDVFNAPKRLEALEIDDEENELHSYRNCYVCKKEFTSLHYFYDSMCQECGDVNYNKRFQTADMTDQVALITGSRLKIGYHSTLMMLRSGAEVIATTRFPVDSALRFAKEEDYPQWKNRLHIYGLDLRHTPSVELFTEYISQKYNRLDVLINNAAQTVRRPPAFYSHLMEHELKNPDDLPDDCRLLLGQFDECKKIISSKTTDPAIPVSWNASIPGMGLHSSAKLSQIPYAHDDGLDTKNIFPAGKLDADLQQVDLRTTNSWRLRLGEISTAEMLEIQLVNSVGPFVLCNRLIPLMKKEVTGKKHIVNVTAMEGKFHRYKKADRHPHTNMAKAALNMLTHTSARGLAKCGIYINAVDTGWVTDEDPVALSKYKQDKYDFHPPLDIVDGAARVCDPFFDGINTNEHWSGKFLKDYFPIDW